METYIVRVNGVQYEVEIGKKDGSTQAVPAAGMQPDVQTAPTGASVQDTGITDEGGTDVECGVAGKVWKMIAKAGDELKKGDPIMVLEAMKMEIPIPAPVDGTVRTIVVNEGDPVEAGQKVAVIG